MSELEVASQLSAPARRARAAMRSRFWPPATLLLAATACTSPGGLAPNPDPLSDTIQSAARQALECRSSVAAEPRYRVIAAHMPLSDLSQATLRQLADPASATREESDVLAAWRDELQLCRDQVVASVLSTDAEYAPMVLAAWNKDDATLVLVVNSKIGWGEAVSQLKTHLVEMLTKIIDTAYRNAAALNRSRDTVLDRRLSILTKLLALVP
jgi:hypothetical protein